MQRSTTKQRIITGAPSAAIDLRTAVQEEETRFGFFLLVFMRIVAGLWLCDGLLNWATVLGSDGEGNSVLAAFSVPGVLAVIFFAVIDLVAAVGLWLATPWGGVIWLVAAGAQLTILLLMPGFYSHPVAIGLADLVLIGGYLALTLLAARGTETPHSGR